MEGGNTCELRCGWKKKWWTWPLSLFSILEYLTTCMLIHGECAQMVENIRTINATVQLSNEIANGFLMQVEKMRLNNKLYLVTVDVEYLWAVPRHVQ